MKKCAIRNYVFLALFLMSTITTVCIAAPVHEDNAGTAGSYAITDTIDVSSYGLLVAYRNSQTGEMHILEYIPDRALPRTLVYRVPAEFGPSDDSSIHIPLNMLRTMYENAVLIGRLSRGNRYEIPQNDHNIGFLFNPEGTKIGVTYTFLEDAPLYFDSYTFTGQQ